MAFSVEIPYGGYWSTPFVRWQGSFSHLHSLAFAAFVAKHELARREIDPSMFDFGVLGMTRPEKGSFYGLPWLMGIAGAGSVGGPTVSQACATSVRAMQVACQEVDSGMAKCALPIACDRTSNGPHIYYPDPAGSGGTGISEDFILENMSCDPLGKHSMVQTAENVATRHRITTGEQHEVLLRREAQYGDALSDDRRFQKCYMTLPFPIPDARFRKEITAIDGDEGVRVSDPASLAKLKPVLDGGTITFGGQTHPADGNAAMIVACPDRAREISRDPRIRIRILGFGQSRAELAYMPEAPIAAADRALRFAGIPIGRVDAIKTHNPFALNDIVFARETGADLMQMNNYGCSLVWGHPNAPTGLRSTIELIEELVLCGGGIGLFAGCAAGDTAMAVVIGVDDR
ncbi:MAG TPA: thiolase family protein [Woeseiaceae bacterium]|jgi:acetyl-CoA acetyltransferase|nr:thiolase family protein [Woeseiaceae bacterium]